MRASEHQLVRYYLQAKRAVLDAGFGPELVWQSSRRMKDVGESEFLSEAAWVIMSSGLSERSVRACFERVASSFLGFSSAAEICRHREECCAEALTYFGHRGKISAIARCAEIVDRTGYEVFAAELTRAPLEILCGVPYLGAITARHLAKNLGVLICKPDRHLVRTADDLGYSVDEFCTLVARAVGDAINVVDVVLWRYAVLRHRCALQVSR